MIKLRSSEGEEFAVAEAVAKMSPTICHMIEDYAVDRTYPLANVDSKILRLVIDYCNKHVPEEKPAEENAAKEMETWDQEFVNVDNGTLCDLVLAANYLRIQGLLDLASKKVVDQVTGKTLEQIREIFQIKEYNPEEEPEVRQENQ